MTSNTSVTDNNGNILTADTSGNFFDTLGNAALSITGTGTPTDPVIYTYTDSSGAAAHYTIKYTNFTIQTAFGCSGITEYGPTVTPLVTEIDLPDGTSKYLFTYESTPGVPANKTGRLASVILPTGATIMYTYSGGSSGNIVCSDGSVPTLTRQTPDGTWTYSRTLVTGTHWQTIVTDPTAAHNQTSIQFQGIYETQRQIYQGAVGGTVIQTVNTCYNGDSIPCPNNSIGSILQRTVQQTIPGPANLIAQHTDKYDLFGNVTESDDYDLATAAPFPLLRQTLTTYTNFGGTINSFPLTMVVKDGSGTVKSRQDFSYDQYSSFTGSNCVTGAPNHDDTGHGCSFTARGNPTSITSYTDPVTPSGGITKSFTYDSLGNLRTAQLNCCQLETLARSE